MESSLVEISVRAALAVFLLAQMLLFS